MKQLIAKENVEDINFHFHTFFLTHITYITHTKNIDFSLAPKLLQISYLLQYLQFECSIIRQVLL